MNDKIEEALEHISEVKAILEEFIAELTPAPAVLLGPWERVTQGAGDQVVEFITFDYSPQQFADGAIGTTANLKNWFLYRRPLADFPREYVFEGELQIDHEEAGIGFAVDYNNPPDAMQRYRAAWWSGQRWMWHATGFYSPTVSLVSGGIVQGWSSFSAEVSDQSITMKVGERIAIVPRLPDQDGGVALWCNGPGTKLFRNLTIDGVSIMPELLPVVVEPSPEPPIVVVPDPVDPVEPPIVMDPPVEIVVEPQFASEATRHGFKWEFANPVRFGRYINGDPWIMPAVVTGLLPVHFNANRSGAMINPLPNGQIQGYDGGLYGSNNEGRYDAGLNVRQALPLALSSGQSLVSAESFPTTQFTPPGLKGAAVLTCEAGIPPLDKFRPPYAGSKKPTYLFSDVRTELLGKLAPVGDEPSFGLTALALERVWLDHSRGWLGRFLHPEDNMPDYGRDMSALLGKACLMLHLDVSFAQKRPLLIAVLQIGIDLDELYKLGMKWPAQGGHGVGRKWPIMFKRAMFGEDPDLLSGTSGFSEDGQTFTVSQLNVDTPGSGYGPEQVGMPEWGEYYYTQQPLGSDGFFAWRENSYRRCCTYNTLAGHLLSARIVGLKSDWGWNVTFRYMDRYMQIESGWTRQLDGWTGRMWDLHRESLGGHVVIPEAWIPSDVWQA